MTGEEFQMVSSMLSLSIREAADTCQPAEFRNLLYAALSTAIYQLPEAYWKEFIQIKPCPIPGCDCHLKVSPEVVAFCKLLREHCAEQIRVHDPRRN